MNRPLPGSVQQWYRLGQAVMALLWVTAGYWAGSVGLNFPVYILGLVTFWVIDILVITPWVERRRRAKALREILAAVGGAK